jgi:pimeloyl-ACP methyl ester carboxylesterase
MGADAWAGMPASRRQTIAEAMSTVSSEWDAAFMEPTPLEGLAALDAPVLLLTGSDSPAASRAVARLLMRALPRVTAVEIEGVGHMAPVTHPERVNALIERHLERSR